MAVRVIARFPAPADWRLGVRESRRQAGEAVKLGLAAAAEGLRTELQAQVRAASPAMGRLANAIRATVYPTRRGSLEAAAFVYARGEAAQTALSAHSTGPVIRSPRGKAIAIPLHGRRGRSGKLSPKFFPGLVFIPLKGGAGQKAIGILASRATGRGSADRKRRRTVGRRAISARLSEAFIPEFILVRAAKLPKRLRPEDVARQWAGRVPGLIEAASRRLGGR